MNILLKKSKLTKKQQIFDVFVYFFLLSIGIFYMAYNSYFLRISCNKSTCVLSHEIFVNIQYDQNILNNIRNITLQNYEINKTKTIKNVIIYYEKKNNYVISELSSLSGDELDNAFKFLSKYIENPKSNKSSSEGFGGLHSKFYIGLSLTIFSIFLIIKKISSLTRLKS